IAPHLLRDRFLDRLAVRQLSLAHDSVLRGRPVPGLMRGSPDRGAESRGPRHDCYCYIKMSWGNCSVKVSSPNGDFHDEPQGVARGRIGGGSVGRAYHDPRGGGGATYLGPPVSATQGALP